jgi:hypothetical protein
MTVFLYKNRTMDNVLKHNICTSYVVYFLCTDIASSILDLNILLNALSS